jgi:hypothetical protein
MIASRLLPLWAAVVANPAPKGVPRDRLRLEPCGLRGPLQDPRDAPVAKGVGGNVPELVDGTKEGPVKRGPFSMLVASSQAARRWTGQRAGLEA